MERPQSSINEVPSNPCVSSWKFPLKVLARSLYAILLQWDKHRVRVTIAVPKSVSWGRPGAGGTLKGRPPSSPEYGGSPDT